MFYYSKIYVNITTMVVGGVRCLDRASVSQSDAEDEMTSERSACNLIRDSACQPLKLAVTTV